MAFTHNRNAKYEHNVGPIYHYDVNGLYPCVMHSYSYPVRRLWTLTGPTPTSLHDHLIEHGGLAAVTIDSDGDTYPVRLPNGQCHCWGDSTQCLQGRSWLGLS